MFTISELLVFCSFAFAICIAPGPNMILASTRGLSHGYLAGFATLAGAIVANYILGALVALGMAKLIIEIPLVFEVIKWAGAAYLIYLAFKAFKEDFRPDLDPHLRGNTPIAKIFFDGLINGISNPKGAMFALAIYSQFWHPERGSIFLQTMILTTILISFDAVIIGAAILFSGKFRDVIMNSDKVGKVMKILVPSVYLGLALKIATTHK